MSRKLLLISLLLAVSVLKTEARTFYDLGVFCALKGGTGFNTVGSTNYTTLSGFLSKMNNLQSGSYSPKSLFRDYSYGRLDFRFKIFPSSNSADTIPYYLDSNDINYYKAYNVTTNPTGYKTQADLDARNTTLRNNIAAYATANLPVGEVLDGDGDGKVDAFTMLWLDDSTNPMGSFNSSTGMKIANKSICFFQSLGVFNLNALDPMPTFVHEVGHGTGLLRSLPDDYSLNSIYRNESAPQSIGSKIEHERYFYNTYSNFIDPKQNIIISKPGTYAINNVNGLTADSCYFRINSPFSKTEYFQLTYEGESVYKTGDQGLFINRVNPSMRGNALSTVSTVNGQPVLRPLPAEIYFLRPFRQPAASTYISRDITEYTDPALILSDNTPAGFRVRNIRKSGQQLKFELEYSDAVPFIDVLDTVDVIKSAGTTIEWPVTVNPANANVWTATSNAAWAAIVIDRVNQLVRITCPPNATLLQRNATFTVSIPGSIVQDVGYLVQRPLNNADVIWLPEVNANLLTINGNEDTHSLRVIGDITELEPLTITASDSIKCIYLAGKTKYLPTREIGFYAYNNNLNTNVNIVASVKRKSGVLVNFTIVQSPVIDRKTYPIKPYPIVNDGKWYTLESQKATKVFGNYLKPVSTSSGTILGLDVFTPSDSIYWTFETNVAGRVVIKNKALGYVDFDLLFNNVLKFKQVKPILGLTMKQAIQSTDIYKTYECNIPVVSFFGDTTALGVLKGLATTTLANNYSIGYNSFSLTNEATRFSFTERSIETVYSLAKSITSTVKTDNSIGSCTEDSKINLTNSISAIYTNYNLIANPTDVQTNTALKAIWALRTTFLNSITKVQTSTSANPIWYRIKTYFTYWRLAKQFYISCNGQALSTTSNINGNDNFMFRFEALANGKMRIIPKTASNKAIKANGSNASYTLTTTFDSYTEFSFMDFPGPDGVKKLIVGNTVASTIPSCFNYVPTTYPAYDTDGSLNNKWTSDLRLYDWSASWFTVNTFDIEDVIPTDVIPIITATTERIISENSIIRVIDRRILVEGSDKVDVYNIYGVKMSLQQRLNTGVYIVKVGNLTQKVIVK